MKAGKKSLTIHLTKAPSAQEIRKYQLRWRAKGSKTWSSESTAYSPKTTFAIGKLKKGQKYEVQARVYKKVNGVNYYSPWSAAATSAKVK